MTDPKERSQIRLMLIGAGISFATFVAPIAIWFYFYTKNSIEQLKDDVKGLKGQVTLLQETNTSLLRVLDAITGIKEEQKKTNDRLDKQQENFEKFKDGYYNRYPRQ